MERGSSLSESRRANCSRPAREHAGHGESGRAGAGGVCDRGSRRETVGATRTFARGREPWRATASLSRERTQDTRVDIEKTRAVRETESAVEMRAKICAFMLLGLSRYTLRWADAGHGPHAHPRYHATERPARGAPRPSSRRLRLSVSLSVSHTASTWRVGLFPGWNRASRCQPSWQLLRSQHLAQTLHGDRHRRLRRIE